MTVVWDDWTGAASVTAVTEYGTTHGGRIISALGSSGEEDRQNLAKMLVAAICQQRAPEAKQYLGALYGADDVDDSPLDRSAGIDPERPQYSRPNGSIYYARKWGDKWDVERLKRARDMHMSTLLLGSPGTGKTAMAEAAFGEELITFPMTGEATVSNLVGGWIPDGKGGYVWGAGPLQNAVTNGLPLLIDEILLGDPSVLAVLYPLMDGRNFLEVSDNPDIGTIYAKEGFYLVGSGNPHDIGSKLSDAMKRRFPHQATVSTDWDLARAMGVDAIIVDIAATMDARLTSQNASLTWAPQFSELIAFKQLHEEWGKDFAVRNLMTLVPEQDREEVRELMSNFIPLDMLRPAKI
jgi:hypothetical protein